MHQQMCLYIRACALYDSVRTIAPSIQSVISQFSEILSFTADVGLNLNVSKLELIQLSQSTSTPIEITLDNYTLATKKECQVFGHSVA